MPAEQQARPATDLAPEGPPAVKLCRVLGASLAMETPSARVKDRFLLFLRRCKGVV
jgi:hypothetical protein